MLGIKSYKNDREHEADKELCYILSDVVRLPENQVLENLGLFLTSKNLSRLLFLNHIYQMIVDMQGIVIDFGTRWGNNAVVFSALRGIYEPFNRHRKIVAFDTFEGFPEVSKEDGESDLMRKGNVSTTEGYENVLDRMLTLHESTSPMSHIKKFEVIKGNVSLTFPEYLVKNPQTIVALAYFDFDLFKPTEDCLRVIRPHLVKGSVLGFDELNDSDSPGETTALNNVFGLNNVSIKRYRYASRVSYFVAGE